MGSDHLPPPDHAAASARLARLGVGGPFLLSVGTVEPRKNQARLLEAYGAHPQHAARALAARPRRSRGMGRPAAAAARGGRWPARCPPPSSPRSTPRPVSSPTCRSSRASGCPRSRPWRSGHRWWRAPLPSTGGAAFEVDPHDVDSIAEGILRVAVDDEVRADLVRRGSEPSSELTWSSIARRHLAVWQRRARRPRRRHVADRPLRLSLDVSAVPTRPAGAGHYIVELARALRARAPTSTWCSSRVARTAPAGSALGRHAPRGSRRHRTPRPVRLAWEQVRLAGFVDRAEHRRPPRPALHHARTGPGARGGHGPRPQLLRVAGLARAVEGPGVPPGDRRGGPPGRGRGLPEPVHRGRARPVVPGGRRGGGRAPRRRHLPLPTRRAGPGSGRGRPLPGSTARLVDGRPFVLFVGTLEPRKDVPSLVEAFARVAARHPDTLLVLAGGTRMGRGRRRRAPSPPRGSARASCGPGTSPTTAVPALLRGRDGGRLSGALRGLRPPGPRGTRLRDTAGHHVRHGDGGGRR